MGVRKTVLPIIISTLIFATLGLSFDAFANTDDLPSQIHAPDRLIVKFNPGVSEEKQNSIFSGQSANVLNHLELLDIKIISVPEQALENVKNALSNNNSVEYAEYDLGVPPAVIPDDPKYNNQWFLPMINAPGAYDITHGDIFPIVILDSGADMDHSDLSSQIIHPYNGFTLVEAPVDHVNGCGHGTPVAGSAAAITNNANGVAGVGWDTKIIPVKITDDTAASNDPQRCYGWSNAVLEGVEWAVTHGAKVVNLSYGFDAGSGHIRDAAQLLRDNNGWLVISAGNSGAQNKTDDYRIIFVSSTTSSDTLSGFSSFGSYVDISAPGSSIHTTVSGNSYGSVSGTSFAAPITASVLNLIYSVDPSLTSVEAFDILKNTAVDLKTEPEEPDGWDEKFGHGRIDAHAAVLTASNNLESTSSPTPVNFKVAFIGDQGSNGNSEAVLTLIASENADMVLHQGDFDYSDDPTDWNNQINTFLPGVPYFASVGNHDMAQWSGYQTVLQNRLNNIPGAVCTGDLGVKASCHYQGLFFILSGVGTHSAYTETEYVTHLQTELANDDSIWSICSWHKNQNAMQVGGKGNETGWDAYEACRQGGAIIATAHEHSYERTKTLSNTETQTIDSSWSDANDVRVAPGSTFAFVSGLGGQNIRDQERCNTPDYYPYECSEWANIYTSNQNANHGSLFCVFNLDGQEDRAYCYFKNISGNIVDSFHVTSFMGSANPTSSPNNPPTALGQSVSTDENVSVGISLASSDPQGDLLSYSIVSTPQNGSISGTGPYLVYTPNLNFAGNDSFSFKTNDGEFDSNTATVSITVNSIVLPPGTVQVRVNSGSDDAEETISDGSMYITSSDIELVDDMDSNGEQIVGLRFNGVEIPQGKTITSAYIEFETDTTDTVSTSLVISAQASDNAATFSSTGFDISSRLTTSASVAWNDIPSWNIVDEKHQTPDLTTLVQEVVNRSGWADGNSMGFLFDGAGSRTAESYEGEATAAALLHIEFDDSPPPNNPPYIAGFGETIIFEDTILNDPVPGVLVNAIDPDGDPLTAVLGTDVANGSLNLNADGSFTYSPNQNFNGEDSFTFHANDGMDDSNIATVTITVIPVNDFPTADAGGPYSATLGNSITFDGTGSSDPDGDTLTYFWDFGDGSNSTLENPSHTYGAADTFTVTLDVNDGEVDSSQSVTSAVVSAPNSAPVADDQSVTITGSSVVIRLTGSDSNGDSLTFSKVSNPSGGRISKMTQFNEISADVTYTVKRSFSGTDSFEFRVFDGTLYSDPATVIITESVVDNPPVANNDSGSVEKAGTVNVDVAANDSDDNGLDLTSIQLVSGPTNGSVIGYTNGTVDYTHDGTDTTSDSFTYTINDNSGATSNVATVNITINGPVSETVVHLSALLGEPSSKGPWNIGTVTITVHNSTHAPISGVVVLGMWSGLFTGDDSCTTNQSGTCTVTDRVKNDSGTATFEVESMSGSGISYDSESNEILDDFISFLVS